MGCNLHIFIPNSFTPNGDDENELLVIRGHNVLTFEMSIYNRWGELMYFTDDINSFWDGKYKNQIVPEGAYSFSFNAYGKDAQYITKMGIVNVLKCSSLIILQVYFPIPINIICKILYMS